MPGSTSTVTLDNNGTAMISSGENALAYLVSLGGQTTGRLMMSGGSLMVGIGGIHLGNDGGPGFTTQGRNGASGIFTLTGGVTNVNGVVKMGGAGGPGVNSGLGGAGGSATLTFGPGGTLTAENGILLGGLGGDGTNRGSGGTGGSGTLTFNSGGALTVTGGMTLGGNGGAGFNGGEGGGGGSGTLTFNSGGTVTVNGGMTVGGNGTSGTGSVTLGGGGGGGTVTLNGGLLTVDGSMNIGGNGGIGANSGTGGGGGSGNVAISSGRLIVNGDLNLGGVGGSGGLGQGGNGTLEVGNGGTLSVTGNLSLGGNPGVASGGSGNVTLNGGAISVSGTITVGTSILNGGYGDLFLDSGTLTTKTINFGTSKLLSFGPTSGQTVVVNANITGLSRQTVEFSSGGTVELNGAADFGGIAINTATTLQVHADNSLGVSGGGISFNGGILDTSGTFSTGRSITLGTGGGTFDTNIGTTLTATGPISGTGSLTKTGLGTLVLAGNNIYLGGTTIDAGTLEPMNFHSLGAGSVTVNSGGTLLINAGVEPIQIGPLSGSGTVNLFENNGLAVNIGLDVSSTFSGTLEGSPVSNVSGAPLFILNGPGTLRLDGTTTLLGVIVVNGGTLDLDSSTALSDNTFITVGAGGRIVVNGMNLPTAGLTDYTAGPAGSIVLNGGSLTVEPSSAAHGAILNFAGNISGTGGFGINGAGITQTLSGNSTYSGATIITAGTLVAGSTTALSAASAFTVDGTLDLSGFDETIGSLTGTGTVTNNGSNLAILTVGNDNSSTSFSGDLTNGGHSLGLTKIGGGTLTLSGFNGYLGPTTINGGTLSVTGTLANSAITVNSGGTLAGDGTLGGPVTISGGGILAPGIPTPATVGTLTVGSLTLNSSSILNYALGIPNQIGGTANDLVVVSGNLTLAGSLNISNVGGFGEGVYRLFNYNGSLTNNGLTFGTLPNGITASELLVETSQAGQINLLVSASGFTDQFWDGTTTVGDGTIHGGSGTWDTTTTNWTNMDGKTNGSWNKGFAIFAGTGGTVTLGGNIQLNGMEFMVNGYTVTAPGSETLMGGASTTIRVDPGVSATIAAPIVDGAGGAATLTKTDAGTLILTATNSYTGGTTISGGTLQLGNGGTSGAIIGNVTDTGEFAVSRSDHYTFNGNIIGTGGFEQIGTGTTILGGNNTYSGTTTITIGTLAAGSANGLSPNSAFVVNGTLDLNGSASTIGSLSGTGTVTNNAIGQGAQLNISKGGDFGGTITQSPSSQGLRLSLSGGTLILTGTNTYVGTLIAKGSAVQLGDGRTTGSIKGFIVDAGTLTIDHSNRYLLNNFIDGTGGLEQKGTGTTIVTADETYKGGTTVTAGSLQIGNGGAAGSIIGMVTDKSILAFDRSDAYTFSGTISGSGAVKQIGTGILTLSGTNTYSGGTMLTSGTLVVDSASALGVGDVTVNGGVLTADPQSINVQGNYFQGPNGILQLNIAGANPGQYDFLNVTGNATLGGTLKLINQGFTPQAGETLTLVKVGGTINNKFASFIDPFTTRTGLNTIDLVYSLHSVDLEFLNIVPPISPTPPPHRITTINFPSFAQNLNELAAGELLHAVELNPRFANTLNFFLSQPFDNIPGDLAIIEPEQLTAFYEISFSNANIQRLSLENRLDEVRASWGSVNTSGAGGGIVGLRKGSSKDGKSVKNPVEPVLQPVAAPRFDLWATGFGDFVKIDSDSKAHGYRFTTGGFDLGFDYRFLEHFAVGIVGGYGHTWTDLRPGTITVNSGRGGLYGTYFNGGYYLNAGVYGGYNTCDSNRRALLGDAIGNTDGEEWSVFASTGYDFHHGNLTVGPIASLQYTNVYINNFSETGSLLPMSIHSDSEESLRSDVGFRASYLWPLRKAALVPYLKATWEHEFKYSALPITAGLAGFPGPHETFIGPAVGQDSAVISAGLSVQWIPTVSVYAGYNGQLGRGRYSSNAVTGGVCLTW